MIAIRDYAIGSAPSGSVLSAAAQLASIRSKPKQ
jgi:hypothetical protein